jgi:hypothetical protein
VSVGVFVKVGVGDFVGVNVGVNVLVGVSVYVGVNDGVFSSTSTKAQLTSPFESVAQLSFPVFVGVDVGEGTEHGGTPVLGSKVPVVFFHSASSAPPL